MLLNKDEGTLYFFHQGMDMGLAFDNIQSEGPLPAVSIRDKVRVRLCFRPLPFSKIRETQRLLCNCLHSVLPQSIIYCKKNDS